MGTIPTPEPPRQSASTEPPATRPYHENGVHGWSEVDGDERRGYTTTCDDCGLPAWGGTPAMAMTRAQQMDRRHLSYRDAPETEPAPDGEIDLTPPLDWEHDAGLGRGL
jgi:hypothetical protein